MVQFMVQFLLNLSAVTEYSDMVTMDTSILLKGIPKSMSHTCR